jgi:hypothetical protein
VDAGEVDAETSFQVFVHLGDLTAASTHISLVVLAVVEGREGLETQEVLI